MEMGKKIKAIREMYGLTQSDMAKIAGVSVASVSAWELGDKKPKTLAVVNICSTFGYDVASFTDSSRSLEEDPLVGVVAKDQDGNVMLTQNKIRISQEELKFLKLFRSINEQGKNYVLQTLDMVADKYKD